MPDLKDGEVLGVQGSGSRPYMMKNSGGVLSCTCPGWRFQSLPIEMRTCRHLRALRGDAAEEARVGTMSSSPKPSKNPVKAPALLLAETWDGDQDVAGWLMSEKLDGVRALWDGKQFLSRQGNRYFAPSWFTAGLPQEALDGELWIGRKNFQRTVSIVRRQDQTDLWKEIRFVVFDTPANDGPFETRLQLLHTIMETNRPLYARAHDQNVCSGHDHLQKEMDRIDALGGEGLMLRQPCSIYTAGRSATLLKVKRFHDCEARVIAHQAGTGRHKGRLGALLVEMANGIQFAVGTGFTDAERANPLPVGSTVSVRYQELTDGGVPRFPSFYREGVHVKKPNQPTQKGANVMSIPKRRFTFVEGNSDKFWEVSTNGNEVTVCYGRNGTSGQTETKTFADVDTANKHAEKKIAEKVKKGYAEVK
jgi:DNA ligase 1